MKAVHHDLIKQRAYAIWEQSGRPQGLDREHWEQAERELLDAAPATRAKVVADSAAENNLGAAAGDVLATDRENLEPEAGNPAPSRARRESPRAR